MGRKKISYYGVKLVSSSVSHPATHRRFDRFRKKNSICKSKSKDPAWGSTTNAELAFSPLCSPLRFLFPFESFQSPTLRPPETSARGVHHGVLDRPLVRHDFNSSRIALPPPVCARKSNLSPLVMRYVVQQYVVGSMRTQVRA